MWITDVVKLQELEKAWGHLTSRIKILVKSCSRYQGLKSVENSGDYNMVLVRPDRRFKLSVSILSKFTFSQKVLFSF